MVNPETYSELSRTPKMERFAKIVNGQKPLTVFSKRSVLGVRMGSEYASQYSNDPFFA